MRRTLLSVTASAVAIACAGRAQAFCRTTTTAVPIGYDPTVNGCITEGTLLAWPSMPVTYQIEQEASSQISLSDATPIVDRSFAKWGQVTCAGNPAKQPSLAFENLGPTDAGYEPCDGGPCGFSPYAAPHVVIFRDQTWPHNDPANTLAITTVTFGSESGRIFASDMEINSGQHTLSTSVPPPVGAYSLEAIVTHEAGHFVGLAHSQVNTAVMYAFYQPDAVTLTDDDVGGICSIYPPGSPGERATPPGCSLGEAGRSGDTVGFVAMGGLAVAIWLARKRGRD